MTDRIRVLGIDLASRRWQDNGSALLEFQLGAPTHAYKVTTPAIQWPRDLLSANAIVGVIDEYARETGVHAVSLDGPQGWREPNAKPRKGVGRLCEYEARAQGKTGEYGRAYPGTQLRWMRFCINVFHGLRTNGEVVNDPEVRQLTPRSDGKYWLLECFPTSNWRTAQLLPLPGKSRTPRDAVIPFARTLWQRYGLGGEPSLNLAHDGHDNLQAVVACLPAAALLGARYKAVPRGQRGEYFTSPEGHWAEGIIWDAEPPEEYQKRTISMPSMPLAQEHADAVPETVESNPITIDERDDEGEQLLSRGVDLFRYLANQANSGNAIGVGYKQLVELVHTMSFEDVVGRGWGQSDVPHVLGLASQITEAAGGGSNISRGNNSILAGLDAFVWDVRSKNRNSTAFERSPYTQQEWNAVFPEGGRRLLREGEFQS